MFAGVSVSTVVTSSTPYCTVRRLFDLVDWRIVADWASAKVGTRPTRRAILDPDDPSGAVALRMVLAASGELESYALSGARYSPEDLQGLTGAQAAFLESIVAGLAVWKLAQRRHPGSAKPKDIPGVQMAVESLEALRKGERIFGIQEVQEAAVMDTVSIEPAETDLRRTVNAARRMFGRRGYETSGGQE